MPGYDLLSRTLTVSEANEIIHDTVESLFYELSIEGEISGFRPASSGHWYFTLKDKGAALDAAVFRSAQYSMVMPDDGDLVIAKGSLSFYAKTGKLTFIVREMKKKGEGDLLQIIEKRKEYYRSLGYFDEDRKKPIPEEINTLGVVTSPTGAAIRDILNITRRRAPSLNILLFPCTVQGDGAAESIAMRIREANNFSACDVLIVGRGGGSIEDLSCFSESEVIEAVHNSEIPVISAVGHEIDWPISDYVADKRAPTPSAAAEIVTETIFRRRERLENALFMMNSLMKEKLSSSFHRLSTALHNASAMENKILKYRSRIPSTEDLRKILILRIQNASSSLAYAEEDIAESMEGKITGGKERITSSLSVSLDCLLRKKEKAEAELRIVRKDADSAIMRKMEMKRLRLSSVTKENEALSPLLILKRGFTVTEKEDGSIVRKASDVKPGDRIKTRTGDGEITSSVIGG